MHFFISTHLQVNPSILNLWLIMINHSSWLWLTRLHFLINWQHYLKLKLSSTGHMIWGIIHSAYGTNTVLHVITISTYSRNRNKSNCDFYDKNFDLKCSSALILMCFLHNLAKKLWLNINMTIIICSIISNPNTEWMERWSSFDAAFNAK